MKLKMLMILICCCFITSCSSHNNTNEYKEENNKEEVTEKDNQQTNESIDNDTNDENANKKNKLIVIDPGHQAKGNNEKEPNAPGSKQLKAKVSSGTSGKASGLNEYELTLQVSLLLKEELIENGYDVIMTRETNNVNISNIERSQIANENKADAFIRIHANGSEDKSVNGAMTICQTASNPNNGHLFKKSYLLSETILDNYVQETGCKKQYVWKTDTMTGINWCEVPATILEMGYMSNKKEDLKMADPAYQKKIVVGIRKGIDTYFDELE